MLPSMGPCALSFFFFFSLTSGQGKEEEDSESRVWLEPHVDFVISADTRLPWIPIITMVTIATLTHTHTHILFYLCPVPVNGSFFTFFLSPLLFYLLAQKNTHTHTQFDIHPYIYPHTATTLFSCPSSPASFFLTFPPFYIFPFIVFYLILFLYSHPLPPLLPLHYYSSSYYYPLLLFPPFDIHNV
jgi:hypothetical protein